MEHPSAEFLAGHPGRTTVKHFHHFLLNVTTQEPWHAEKRTVKIELMDWTYGRCQRKITGTDWTPIPLEICSNDSKYTDRGEPQVSLRDTCWWSSREFAHIILQLVDHLRILWPLLVVGRLRSLSPGNWKSKWFVLFGHFGTTESLTSLKIIRVNPRVMFPHWRLDHIAKRRLERDWPSHTKVLEEEGASRLWWTHNVATFPNKEPAAWTEPAYRQAWERTLSGLSTQLRSHRVKVWHSHCSEMLGILEMFRFCTQMRVQWFYCT